MYIYEIYYKFELFPHEEIDDTINSPEFISLKITLRECSKIIILD